jgi:hypothetical protein
VGEADFPRDPSLAPSRRSSASLNDDFFDIGHFQQLATNYVQTRATKGAWIKATDMRPYDVQIVTDDRHFS